MDSGKSLKSIITAYTTFGKLNAAKDNAILICHALTGDQYVASKHPITKKEGWWVTAVGPGKAIDTNKYFVICANVIGGCMGSWGPKEIDKNTNEPYGLNFPVITIRDIVKSQETLLEYLGIKKLLSLYKKFNTSGLVVKKDASTNLILSKILFLFLSKSGPFLFNGSRNH